jgi:ribosomal protein L37E
MTPDFKEKVMNELKKRGAVRPCHRCGNNSIQLLDGFFKHTIQNDIQATILGGPSIPSVGVICPKCGNVSFHALGILDMLENKISGTKNV